MISRFNQLFLALTTVTPLLLSVAIVLILLYPSGYWCGWVDLINLSGIPDSIYWWLTNIFILLFFISWRRAFVFLGRLSEGKRCIKSITLSDLQPYGNNILTVVSMLPPWLTLFWEHNVMIVLIMTFLLSIVVTYILSRQGYLSLIFLFCGYRLYDGTNTNGMKMKLLSRRVWRNHKDVRDIVLISDNFALII